MVWKESRSEAKAQASRAEEVAVIRKKTLETSEIAPASQGSEEILVPVGAIAEQTSQSIGQNCSPALAVNVFAVEQEEMSGKTDKVPTLEVKDSRISASHAGLSYSAVVPARLPREILLTSPLAACDIASSIEISIPAQVCNQAKEAIVAAMPSEQVTARLPPATLLKQPNLRPLITVQEDVLHLLYDIALPLCADEASVVGEMTLNPTFVVESKGADRVISSAPCKLLYLQAGEFRSTVAFHIDSASVIAEPAPHYEFARVSEIEIIQNTIRPAVEFSTMEPESIHEAISESAGEYLPELRQELFVGREPAGFSDKLALNQEPLQLPYPVESVKIGRQLASTAANLVAGREETKPQAVDTSMLALLSGASFAQAESYQVSRIAERELPSRYQASDQIAAILESNAAVESEEQHPTERPFHLSTTDSSEAAFTATAFQQAAAQQILSSQTSVEIGVRETLNLEVNRREDPVRSVEYRCSLSFRFSRLSLQCLDLSHLRNVLSFPLLPSILFCQYSLFRAYVFSDLLAYQAHQFRSRIYA